MAESQAFSLPIDFTPELLSKVLRPPSGEEGSSRQGMVMTGEQMHPVVMEAVRELRPKSTHHEACINAKRDCLIGQGHYEEGVNEGLTAQEAAANPTRMLASHRITEVDRVLNPMTKTSWQETLADIAEDVAELANGYLEVVRDRSGRIVGLYHVQAPKVSVFVEDVYRNHHFIVRGGDNGGREVARRYAKFGDRERFWRAFKENGGFTQVRFPSAAAALPSDEDYKSVEEVPELIHFRVPTSRNDWYGVPDWLSAVNLIEIKHLFNTYQGSFFKNRGVPEFIFSVLNASVEPETWKKIESVIRKGVGADKAFSSIALHLPDPDAKIQVDKLGVDESATENRFGKISEALAVEIATAHQVPPLLAGILIPGKLGASNEMANALMVFQVVKLGPLQKIISQALGRTLGQDPSIPLAPERFRLAAIHTEIDIGRMETMGRMRQQITEAAREGRDLDEGLRD